MAFDGSAYDSLSALPGPVWLRPASRQHALASFPRFIYLLKRSALVISVPECAEGPRVVRAYAAGRVEDRWVMLYPDFEKCKRVAASVSVPLFRTEPVTDTLARIQALVSVEYP